MPHLMKLLVLNYTKSLNNYKNADVTSEMEGFLCNIIIIIFMDVRLFFSVTMHHIERAWL